MQEAADVSLAVSSAVWYWAPQKVGVCQENDCAEQPVGEAGEQAAPSQLGCAVTKGISLIFSRDLWNTMVWQGASVIFVELYSSYRNGALSLCRRRTQISGYIFQLALLVHGRIFLYASTHGGDWQPVCTWSAIYAGDLTFLPQSELGRAHFTVEMQDPKHLLVDKQIPPYPGTDNDSTSLPETKPTYIWKAMPGQMFSQKFLMK